MPSPFPGMDPFLEVPAQWHGVHNKLITHVEEASAISVAELGYGVRHGKPIRSRDVI